MLLPWSGQRLLAEVDQIFERARQVTDLRVQSDYAKYLVIRVSGVVEQVITEIVIAHTSAQASPTVASHVAWRMGTFQNPNIERLLQLTWSFNPRWRQELEHEVTQPERGALGSINAQRNLVAHGQPSTVSLAQVADYYSEIKSVLTKIASKF